MLAISPEQFSAIESAGIARTIRGILAGARIEGMATPSLKTIGEFVLAGQDRGLRTPAALAVFALLLALSRDPAAMASEFASLASRHDVDRDALLGTLVSQMIGVMEV